jgi:hypothetical protein
MSEVYPCIYGLREHCEAIEFAFRLFAGELKKQLDLLSKIEEGEREESRSDEERIIARIAKALGKSLPKYVVQMSGHSADVILVDILVRMCDMCPHRLKVLSPEERAHAVTPAVTPQVIPAPPREEGEEK